MLGVVATVGVFSFALDRRYDASLGAVHESFARRQAVDEVLSLLKDAETGQRGFVLTGDEQFLVPYTFASQHLGTRLQRLADAAKDDPAESASVQEITREARAKMDELAQTIQLRHHGRTEDAMTIVREGRGRRLMVAIRAEATRMLAREATRLHERERDAAAGRRRLTIIAGGIWVLFFLSVTTALGVAIRGMRDLRRVYEQLKQNEGALRAVADNASDLVRMIGEDGQLVYVSPSCERMLGYSREEMMAMPPRALLPEEERENAEKIIMGAQAGLAETGRFVHRLRTKAGDLRWFETYYCLVREGTKKTTRIHLTSRDINERHMQENASKAQADLLRNLSLRDELTGLYNRRGLLEHAQQALRAAARLKHPACLFYVDLNGMKRINDTLGHQAGDRAIVATARILSGVFRESDIVARLGGDEFAILAANCGPEQVAIVRKRLMAAIDELNQSRKEPFQLSVSVGEGIYDPQAPSALEALMESADRAMYGEKRARGHRTASIDPHSAPSPRE